MELVKHKDISDFRRRCRDWLMRDEALHNGLIGSLDLLVEGSSVYSPPYWFGTVEDDGEILGVGMHTKPDGLITTNLPGAVLQDVFKSVDEVVGPPHRIMAPDFVANWLANMWAQNDELRRKLQCVWNVYNLEACDMTKIDVPGKLRMSTDSDQETARRWGEEYGIVKPAPVDVAQFMLRKMRRKELYFWENDGPTTMLTLSSFTANGVRISSVFTPKESRGHRYASAMVSGICGMLFEKGMKFVTLVAVDGDPAERIYQRLGFKKIGSRSCYNLEPL